MANKKSKTISQDEAVAYKTKAEGTATIVNAWMPLMKLVTLSVIFLIAWQLGRFWCKNFKTMEINL